MKGILNGWIAACACWGACGFASAQEFTIEGRVPGMRDGVSVALLCNHETLAETRVKDGVFRLQGSVARPEVGTLVTNNLDLVQQHGWPKDSICWTYTDVFVDNVPMTVQARNAQLVYPHSSTMAMHSSMSLGSNRWMCTSLMGYR